jgi:beta-phosphoglucomutase-like phosphatase (HAD superfamily)
MQLQPFVDMIMCGDDPEGRPKPDPHNALHICKTLKVSPTDTIMVGDTPADTLMGQQAALGLTVGVLTGVGDLRDLQDADVIVKDVHECVDMILPNSNQEQPVYQVLELLSNLCYQIYTRAFRILGDDERHFQNCPEVAAPS